MRFGRKKQKEAPAVDWDAVLQESINDASMASGCGIGYSRKGLDATVEIGGIPFVEFSCRNPEFGASMYLDGFEAGVKLMQGKLRVKPGEKYGNKYTGKTVGLTPEDQYDAEFRKVYAKIAVERCEDLTTEGLLLLMRQCFIEGRNA